MHDSGIQSLGGSIHEMRTWLEIMELAPRAQTHTDRKKLDWLISSILEGYVATMDCPAATLVPEIHRVYPDAVVIATTRDHDAWWRSMEALNNMMGAWWLPYLVLWLHKAQVYGMWAERFGGVMRWRYGDERIVRDTIQKHEDHLRHVVPPGRLFWYDVRDGWEPLCKILDLPVPDQPFPHNNNRQDARKVFQEHVIAGIVSWMYMLAFFTVVGWYGLRWYQGYFQR